MSKYSFKEMTHNFSGFFLQVLWQGYWILNSLGTSGESNENVLVEICKDIVSWKKVWRVYFSCYFKGPFSRFRIWAAHPRQYQIKWPPGFLWNNDIETYFTLKSLITTNWIVNNLMSSHITRHANQTRNWTT